MFSEEIPSIVEIIESIDRQEDLDFDELPELDDDHLEGGPLY